MNSRDKPLEGKAPKKPYRSPVLEVYGNIREITKNFAGSGKNDNVMASSKTSP